MWYTTIFKILSIYKKYFINEGKYKLMIAVQELKDIEIRFSYKIYNNFQNFNKAEPLTNAF